MSFLCCVLEITRKVFLGEYLQIARIFKQLYFLYQPKRCSFLILKDFPIPGSTKILKKIFTTYISWVDNVVFQKVLFRQLLASPALFGNHSRFYFAQIVVLKLRHDNEIYVWNLRGFFVFTSYIISENGQI